MIIKYSEIHDHPGGLFRLTFVVSEERSRIFPLMEKVKEGEWELDIKPKTKKRSMDANAYYWSLAEQLAKVLRTSVKEIHQKMLEDYGTMKTREDGRPIVFTLRADIDPKEVTKYTKILKVGEINGVKAIQYAVLKGSSEMNSKEFAALLDGLIYECKEAGIETLTPLELQEMYHA